MRSMFFSETILLYIICFCALLCCLWYLRIIACIWFIGFIVFIHTISHFRISHRTDPICSDVIVVFTGYPHRITQGIQYFREKKAPYLYISGIGQGKKRTDIPFVFYDYARNTKENILYTNAWLRTMNIRSVILVTSDYHIPRCLWHGLFGNIDCVIAPVITTPESSFREVVCWIREYHKCLLLVLYSCCTLCDHYFGTKHASKGV